MSDDKYRNLVIVTGASRGIGKEIARQMAAISGIPSRFLLIARDEKNLAESKTDVLNECPYGLVDCLISDMAYFGAQEYTETLQNIILKHPPGFHNLYLFHNVGTAGDVSSRAIELDSPQDWQKYLDVNLLSMIQLNNITLRLITPQVAQKRFVINITSLIAIQGFPSFAQYAVGKAARESFFRVLTAEESDVKVLQYSPGPVDTDMHTYIGKCSFDEETRNSFASEQTSDVNRSTLTPHQTVTKLVKILRDNKFESGARVDYFDK